ncbi:hypothetical protein C8Q76DRAFT_754127 [Earliella scabrosa]|nr:hypothetical protein C8Q76DRAFT_754127 [Earliella scabrosa]
MTRDWDLNRIASGFLQQGGMATLVTSTYPSVHITLLAPVVTTLYGMLFATRQGQLGSVEASGTRRHSESTVATTLIRPYVQFLGQLELKFRSNRYKEFMAQQGLLAKVIAIAGYLSAFVDPASTLSLDAMHAMQSFLTTTLSLPAGPRGWTSVSTSRPAITAESSISVEMVAAGLVRVLSTIAGCIVSDTSDRGGYSHDHCLECTPTVAALDSAKKNLSDTDRHAKTRSELWAMMRATLWSLHNIILHSACRLSSVGVERSDWSQTASLIDWEGRLG